MIEIITRQYLSSKLDVPVYIGEEPKNKPAEYVVINVIDGGRIDMIDAVTFDIRSFSTSPQKAAELNKKVRNAMFGITVLPDVSASKCGGGGQDFDLQTKRYAYSCIFNLFYMEKED